VCGYVHIVCGCVLIVCECAFNGCGNCHRIAEQEEKYLSLEEEFRAALRIEAGRYKEVRHIELEGCQYTSLHVHVPSSW
jgi:hypothetical protein